MKKIIVPVLLVAMSVALPCLAENPKIKNDANGHFYQKFTQKKSWTDARSSCEKMGGYLVTVTSEEERLFLMNNIFQDSRQSFWAGATDFETEGQWKWITGEPLNYTDWARGEPNDEKEEDYLELPLYFNYQWNDVPNAVKPNCYVCEWEESIDPALKPALARPANNSLDTNSNDSVLADFLDTLAAQGKKSPSLENQKEKSAPPDPQPANSSIDPQPANSSIDPQPDNPSNDPEPDNPSKVSHKYFIPLFEYSENVLTGLGLSNSSVIDDANIRITVFDTEGDEIMTESVNILSDGQQTLVLYPDDNAARGWISVDSDQPLTGVCFMIATGAGTDNFMADIPLSRQKHRNLHVPHVSYDTAWDTTFFIANPNENAQTVYIDVVGSDGKAIVSRKDEIASNGCGQYSLSSLLGTRELMGGKVKIFGADGLTAYALYTNIKTGARSFAGISPMEPF